MSFTNNTNATTTNTINATPSDVEERVIAHIDDGTLLQVDATAIVGIFIFLTLRQLLSYGHSDPKSTLLLWRLTFIGVLPFAISAILILLNTFYPFREDAGPRVFTLLGFLYILAIFGIIFLYQWREGKKPMESEPD
jgi:hypothetical protein